ncbi:MAG: hypothetical protein Q8P24_14965 [Desulfobacterales bacterium]|nr:hypothetical protein [Desulfobacterales bacterium]
MKTLHIMRSQPDEMVRMFVEGLGPGGQSSEFPLYGNNVNYDRLVEEIFESERVISWW